MNNLRVLLIKNETINTTGATLTEIEEVLKIKFETYNYMIGFLEGRLFDNYKLLELNRYETYLNKKSDYYKDYYVKFISFNYDDRILEED